MCYFYSGIIASTLFGAALPGFCLFFGDMVDEMGASTSNNTGVGGLKDSALTLIYFAFFVWAASGLQITMMAMYAERVAHKVKLDYFLKCIEKDADYFDQHNPTEMAARISKETAAMQRGIGEKFGNIVMSFSSFLIGYAFAFYWGWKLTLILLGCLPIMMCVGSLLGITLKGGMIEQLKAYA